MMSRADLVNKSNSSADAKDEVGVVGVAKFVASSAELLKRSLAFEPSRYLSFWSEATYKDPRLLVLPQGCFALEGDMAHLHKL